MKSRGDVRGSVPAGVARVDTAPQTSGMKTPIHLMAALVALALASPVLAQDPAPEAGLKVGDMAPDFTLPASTKDGVSPLPVHLADLRGQTVVLAFFAKARTGG